MRTSAADPGPKTLKEAWAIFDGLPLLYRTNASPAPDGARTILHLHGFAISGRYLLPTASRLASDYTTYVPDLPGAPITSPPRLAAITRALLPLFAEEARTVATAG